MERRALLRILGAAGLAAALLACGNGRTGPDGGIRGDPVTPRVAAGRIAARPGGGASGGGPGLHTVPLGAAREVLLYVPASYDPRRPMPLAVMLHGAGGEGARQLAAMRPLADASGFMILAPSSKAHTWDVIAGGYGADVALIDRALAHVFERWAVDPARLGVGGFSDGASYALSLGITNGDLFTHVLAFSPGFMAPGALFGSPRIFVSHGTDDRVLPIDRCSRRLVPQLEKAGYTVRYQEFEGPHTVPPEVAAAGARWLVGG